MRALVLPLFVLLLSHNLWAIDLTCDAIFGQDLGSGVSTSLIIHEEASGIVATSIQGPVVNGTLAFNVNSMEELLGRFNDLRASASDEQIKAIEGIIGEEGILGNLDFLDVAWKFLKADVDSDTDDKNSESVHFAINGKEKIQERRDFEKLVETWKKRLEFEITEKGEISFETIDFFTTRIFEAILHLYSIPEDQTFNYLKDRLNGSSKLAFKRRDSLAKLKASFAEEEVRLIMWSLTLTNLMSLKQFNSYKKTSNVDMMFRSQSDEILVRDSRGRSGQIILSGLADGFLTGLASLVTLAGEFVFFGTGVSIYAAPAIYWAWLNFHLDGDGLLPTVVERFKLRNNRLIAEVNAGLIKRFIRDGDMELLISPTANQLDGQYEVMQLEAQRSLDADRVRQRLSEINTEDEARGLKAEILKDLEASLMASSENLYFSDPDYEKVIVEIQKTLETGKPTRRLKSRTGRARAFLQLTARASGIREDISRTNNLLDQLKKIVEFVEELMPESDYKSEFVAELRRYHATKKESNSGYLEAAETLERIATEIKRQSFENVAQVIGANAAIIQKSAEQGIKKDVRDLVPAARTTDIVVQAVQGGNLPAIQFENDYQRDVYESLVARKYTQEDIMKIVQHISNEHQVRAIKAMNLKKINIADHIIWIKKISTELHAKVVDRYIRRAWLKEGLIPRTWRGRVKANNTPVMLLNINEITTEIQYQVIDLLATHGNPAGRRRNQILQFSNSYQVEALRAFLEAGRAIDGAFDHFLKVNTAEAVTAIRLLADHNYQNITAKLGGIVRFNNEHQIFALKGILSQGRPLGETIHYLAEIENEFQALAVDLAARSNLPIRKNMPEFLLVNSDLQYRAIRALLADDGMREMFSVFAKEVIQFDNEHSVAALEALMKAKYSNKHTAFQKIRQVNHPIQVQVIEYFTGSEKPFLGEMDHILSIQTQPQLDAFKVIFRYKSDWMTSHVKFAAKFSSGWASRALYYLVAIQTFTSPNDRTNFLKGEYMDPLSRISSQEQFEKIKTIGSIEELKLYLLELE